MWFWASIVIATVGGLTQTFTGRLHATGLWAGRALVHPDLADRLPTGLQDALTDGWPSRISFFSILFPIVSAGVGFMHAWWMVPVAFLVVIFSSSVWDRFPTPSPLLNPYLEILLAHATRRAKGFKAGGDLGRAAAATDLANDVQGLLDLYAASGVRAPSVREASAAPFGDRSYLLTGVR